MNESIFLVVDTDDTPDPDFNTIDSIINNE